MMWCYTVTTTYTGMSLWCHDYELEQTQYPKYSTVLNLITTVITIRMSIMCIIIHVYMYVSWPRHNFLPRAPLDYDYILSSPLSPYLSVPDCVCTGLRLHSLLPLISLSVCARLCLYWSRRCSSCNRRLSLREPAILETLRD